MAFIVMKVIISNVSIIKYDLNKAVKNLNKFYTESNVFKSVAVWCIIFLLYNVGEKVLNKDKELFKRWYISSISITDKGIIFDKIEVNNPIVNIECVNDYDMLISYKTNMSKKSYRMFI